MDNARMNSSNSMHPSWKTHKHDPIKSHVLFTCWLAFNVWVSFNSKKSMDRFIQWIKLLFRPLGAPQSAAKQRTLLPAYRSTSANLSFNEVANDVAKVRGNESFLLPAAKDKRTAHSSADKAKVKGCEYFVDAPASKERKTLWIFFFKNVQIQIYRRQMSWADEKRTQSAEWKRLIVKVQTILQSGQVLQCSCWWKLSSWPEINNPKASSHTRTP